MAFCWLDFLSVFSVITRPLPDSRFAVPRQVEGSRQKLRPQFAHESMGTQLLLAGFFVCLFGITRPVANSRFAVPRHPEAPCAILLERLAPMLTKLIKSLRPTE
jgi:hypothetical protein